MKATGDVDCRFGFPGMPFAFPVDDRTVDNKTGNIYANGNC